ncbi:hypothetical protein [Xanthomonas arboricola]|uniref:hypothetical protein n=1 Tax=Xanthomonas arboricola TaxID=56448 RepID=UPI0011B09EC4|nr:hypothetical protein [Xanthomonas arboricola]
MSAELRSPTDALREREALVLQEACGSFNVTEMHHSCINSALRRRCRSTHSHSIINKPRRPAWLKGFSVIDMGLYRRSYRQKRTSFADAGDGAICGATTLPSLSSIRVHLNVPLTRLGTT